MLAVLGGCEETIRYLVERGADLSKKNANNVSAR